MKSTGTGHECRRHGASSRVSGVACTGAWAQPSSAHRRGGQGAAGVDDMGARRHGGRGTAGAGAAG